MSKRVKIHEAFDPNRPHIVLGKDQYVKDVDRKKDRPSVFIGSSRESLPIAQRVKACFDLDRYEVDIWDEGVFGTTTADDVEGLSNVEWLKNFTDIYDFALFIFVPEDDIVLKTRALLDGKKEEEAKTAGTRHNVVFEFGLFLGRIGAKRSFILADQAVEEFLRYFFTDLSQNLEDTERQAGGFRVEIYRYKGVFKEYIDQKVNLDRWDDSELVEQVEQIKSRMSEVHESVEVGFLPSTSLALGYFNNFVGLVAKTINHLRKNRAISEAFVERMKSDDEFSRTVLRIRSAHQVHLKIIRPSTIQQALQFDIGRAFPESLFEERNVSGESRQLRVKCLKSSLEDDADALVFYDLPATLNSSMRAVEMLTPFEDIKQLLFEKERRNFDKAIEYILEKAERGESLKAVRDRDRNESPDDNATRIPNIREIVSIISWEDFLAETGQA